MANTATTSCRRGRLMRPLLRLSAPSQWRPWAAMVRARGASGCISAASADGACGFGLGLCLHGLDDVADGVAEGRQPLWQARELAELGGGKRLHAEAACAQILDARRG